LFEEVLGIRRKLLGPEHPATLDAMSDLALSCDRGGRHDEALKLREQTLSLVQKVRGPSHRDTLKAMENLASSYAETGRSSEALNLQAKVCELNSKNTDASLTLATLQTWFGRDTDYEASRRRLAQQAQGTDQAGTAERAAKAVCLRPCDDTALLTNALTLARQGVELGKDSSSLPYYQLTLGLADYRNGQYAAAEQSILAAEHTAPDQEELQGIAHMFRAMALFREGRVEEARRLFIQAQTQVPPLPADETKPAAAGRPFNHDLLIWWLSFKEAKSIIEER
jgi:tetratricopeptide (TPR) repeat protein